MALNNDGTGKRTYFQNGVCLGCGLVFPNDELNLEHLCEVCEENGVDYP